MNNLSVLNTAKNRNSRGQFAKGNQEGNRSGRPKKGLAIADILNSKLDEVEDGRTHREMILEKVISLALAGERWAIEFIADRTEGKALERMVQHKEHDVIVIE
ncbi:MAG: DUF5681 domain-containing protein [Calditrichaceae bacterium]